MVQWKERLRAAGIHLGMSLAIALLAGLLVFGVWYPYPYREISGGRELFMLLVAVDVVLGPLLTLAIFDRTKTWPTLRRDLAVIGLLQLAGLSYGLWTVFVARPVHLVFEIDRFRVVHAVDVPADLLPKAPPALQRLPLWGPTALGLRPFVDANEKMNATLAALAGADLGARPDFWQPYALSAADVAKAAKPLAQLKSRFPDEAQAIDRAVASSGRTAEAVATVPLVGRKSFWTVFVDARSGAVLAFLPIDSF
ncbi:MAG: pilus assembly protein [Rhodoferax sp.]|nr:pilus assembly protein [Rhodoferax sp.]